MCTSSYVLWRTSLAACVLLLASSAALAAQHAFGDFKINVAADTSDISASAEYQITVEDQELLLSRLTAGYTGTLSNSFVTDLNKDGAFEVIVTFSYADGHETDVHLYTWKDSRLEPHKVTDLNTAQLDGYRGNDEFAVADGEFVRIYQLYELTDGKWLPTAEQRRLRYSFDESRWLVE